MCRYVKGSSLSGCKSADCEGECTKASWCGAYSASLSYGSKHCHLFMSSLKSCPFGWKLIFGRPVSSRHDIRDGGQSGFNCVIKRGMITK